MDLDAGLVENGFDAHSGELVDDFEAEVREDAVLAGDSHDVRRDADGDEVHAGEPELVGQLILLAVTLYKFKADAAT